MGVLRIEHTCCDPKLATYCDFVVLIFHACLDFTFDDSPGINKALDMVGFEVVFSAIKRFPLSRKERNE